MRLKWCSLHFGKTTFHFRQKSCLQAIKGSDTRPSRGWLDTVTRRTGTAVGSVEPGPAPGDRAPRGPSGDGRDRDVESVSGVLPCSPLSRLFGSAVEYTVLCGLCERADSEKSSNSNIFIFHTLWWGGVTTRASNNVSYSRTHEHQRRVGTDHHEEKEQRDGEERRSAPAEECRCTRGETRQGRSRTASLFGVALGLGLALSQRL